MYSHLHRLIAQARADEFRRAAADSGRARPHMNVPMPLRSSVTLRFGFPDDLAALTRLATLDSSVPPPQPVLVAEVAGQLRAAVSLSDGSVVADPFFPSAPVVDLLRARAAQLRHAAREDRHGRRRLRSAGRLRLPAWR
jgi:hypothetical protein